MIAGTALFCILMGYAICYLGCVLKDGEEKGSDTYSHGLNVAATGFCLLFLGITLACISLGISVSRWAP